MIPNAVIYIPKEALSFAKEYSIIIKRVSIEFISFVYLGIEYHVKFKDKSEIIHWFIKTVKENASSVVAFNNCTSLYAIDLGQMTDIMDYTPQEIDEILLRRQNAKEAIKGRCELLDWVKDVLKAKRVEQKGEYEKWQIYGIEVILFENEFSVNKINDCLNCFDYKNWEQAIEKIIEIIDEPYNEGFRLKARIFTQVAIDKLEKLYYS